MEPGQHDQVLRSAGRNGAVGAVGAVFASGAGLLLTLQVAKLLGTSHSGLFFSAVAIATLLTTAATAGADTGLVWSLAHDGATRQGASQRYLLKVALGPVVLVSLTFAAVLWLAAPGVGDLLSHSEPGLGASLIRIMAVALVAGTLLQCLAQATRGMGDVRPFSALQQFSVPGLRVVLLAVMTVLASTTGPDLVAVVWTVPLVLVLPVAGLLVLRRAAPAPPGSRPPEGLRRSFWRYSLARGLGSTTALALVWIDIPLVAVLAGPAAAGAYAVASRFATSGQMSLQAMRLAVGPEIAAAFATHDKPRVRALYGLSTQWATLLSWPVFVLLFVFAHPVLDWFGPDFSSATWALRILCLAMMVSVATGNVDTVLLMSGHSGWTTINSMVALVAMVAIDLVAVPAWSTVGAALGWGVAILIDNGLGLWLVHSRLDVPSHGRSFWAVAGAVTVLAVTAGLVAVLVLGTTTQGIVLGVALTLAGMAAFVYFRRSQLMLRVLFGRGKVSGVTGGP